MANVARTIVLKTKTWGTMAVCAALFFAASPVDASRAKAHKSLSRLKTGLKSVRESMEKANLRLSALQKREESLKAKTTEEIRPQSIPAIDRGLAVVQEEVLAMKESSPKALHVKLRTLLKRGYTKALSLVVASQEHEPRLLSAEDVMDGLNSFKSKEQFLTALKKVIEANEPTSPRSFELAQAELEKIRFERKALIKKVKKCGDDERMILAEMKVVGDAGDAEATTSKNDFERPVHGKITSGFGMRVHPLDNIEKEHKGVDFAAKEGDNVRAAANGSVIFAGVQNGYGNVVIIQHANGFTTRYAHLSEIAVGIGESVDQGTTIGKAGMTGNATGPHLHFEVRENDIPVDPQKYL